ncbi:MAG TPA: hypothetical protein VFA55_09300 [Candidatus Kapabacteria bacterium]|nr:hypothetical protein [Candidatus Kapabacteria bacterium]
MSYSVIDLMEYGTLQERQDLRNDFIRINNYFPPDLTFDRGLPSQGSVGATETYNKYGAKKLRWIRIVELCRERN